MTSISDNDILNIWYFSDDHLMLKSDHLMIMVIKWLLWQYKYWLVVVMECHESWRPFWFSSISYLIFSSWSSDHLISKSDRLVNFRLLVLTSCLFYFPTTMVVMYCYGTIYSSQKLILKNRQENDQNGDSDVDVIWNGHWQW